MSSFCLLKLSRAIGWFLWPQYTGHPTEVFYIISLQALKEICSDLLPLYGEVCLLGDFNVDHLDPGHSLFPRFLDFLEMVMLCNVAIFRREEHLASF
jgi:hypothetical protein